MSQWPRGNRLTLIGAGLDGVLAELNETVSPENETVCSERPLIGASFYAVVPKTPKSI